MDIIFITYFLMAYGVSNLLVFGTGPFDILSKIREWCDEHITTVGDMLKCMMCTSTNVGWVFSLLNLIFLPSLPLTPFNLIIRDPSLWYLIIVLDACVTSGVVWLTHTLQEALERWNNA